MPANDRSSFQELLERLSLPYVIITGLATSLANLNSVIAQAGWRILSISALAVALLWVYHVFTHRAPSLIAPGYLLAAHDRDKRFRAVALVLLSAIPVWLAFRPERSFELPSFSAMIWNETKAQVSLDPLGEFNITGSTTPVMETQIAAGKFQLGNGRQEIHVSPDTSMSVDASFLSSPLYEPFYQRGDFKIRFLLRTRDGRILPSATIPFQQDWLIGEPIVFYAKSTGT